MLEGSLHKCLCLLRRLVSLVQRNGAQGGIATVGAEVHGRRPHPTAQQRPRARNENERNGDLRDDQQLAHREGAARLHVRGSALGASVLPPNGTNSLRLAKTESE